MLKKTGNPAERYNHNKESVHFNNPEANIQVPFTRELLSSARRYPYFRSDGGLFFVPEDYKWKQFFAELEFLTANVLPEDNCVAVYPAVVGGKHIPIIAKLFPQIQELHLYRKTNLSRKLTEYVEADPRRVQVFDGPFNMENAAEYQPGQKKYEGKKILLIHDVCTMQNGLLKTAIHRDMLMQKFWYDTMRPNAALLSFRLPFMKPNKKNEKYYEYLDGKLYYLTRQGASSSEVALWVNGQGEKKVYKCREYQDIIFRHNVCTRVQSFDHQIPSGKVDGLCNCYDCAANVHIWKMYLQSRIPAEELENEVIQRMNDLIEELGNPLIVGAHKIGVGMEIGTRFHDFEIRPELEEAYQQRLKLKAKKSENFYKGNKW